VPTRLWHDRARCSTRQGTGIASGRCSSAQNHVPRRRASHGTGIQVDSEHPPSPSLECPVGKGARGAPSLSESPVTEIHIHAAKAGERQAAVKAASPARAHSLPSPPRQPGVRGDGPSRRAKLGKGPTARPVNTDRSARPSWPPEGEYPRGTPVRGAPGALPGQARARPVPQ
jgi:hypothetical protein